MRSKRRMSRRLTILTVFVEERAFGVVHQINLFSVGRRGVAPYKVALPKAGEGGPSPTVGEDAPFRFTIVR